MGKNVKIFEGVKMALKNGWMIVSRSPIEDSEAAQFLYENSSCFLIRKNGSEFCEKDLTFPSWLTV